MSTSADPIIFVGPLPPPMHGQSMVTSRLVEVLSKTGARTKYVNTGGNRFHGEKAVAHFLAIVFILLGGRSCYISVNSNRGMWLTAVLAAIARIRGVPLALHHHSYAHIAQRTLSMVALARMGGPMAVHIVLSESMGRKLIAATPEVGRVVVLNNAGFVTPKNNRESAGREPGQVVLGHISNLTREKGVGEAVEAAISLVEAGQDVHLIVAGPACDRFADEAIARGQSRLGKRFTYRGAVYGQEKEDFFDSIDLLLFPSTYRNEAEPVVLLESLAKGIPCMAYDVGCIADDLGVDGGQVIAPGENFSNSCHSFVKSFSGRHAKDRAIHRFAELVAAHEQQLSRVLELLMCENL